MIRTLTALLLLSFFIAGCSTIEEKPVGIGYDMDALKQSACPCGKVFYKNGVNVS